MFMDEPDARPAPMAERWRGMLVGTLLLVAACGALIFARALPLFVALLLATSLLQLVRPASAPALISKIGLVEGAVLSFLAYASVTALWAESPPHVLAKTGVAAASAALAWLLARMCFSATRTNILHIAEGLWIGFLAGLIIYLTDAISDQEIKRWLFNAFGATPETLIPKRFFTWQDGHLTAISRDLLAWNTTAIPLLVWPSLMAAIGSLPTRTNYVIAGVIFLLAASAVALSPHETSKVAIIGGVLTFLLSCLSARWTLRALGVAWVAACLLIVPASLLAHRMNLHNAPRLQASAQHRIIIWNYTAEQTLASPVIGVGADMTHILGPRLNLAAVNDPTERQQRMMSQHAHNLYLQTWYELGFVGAMLLLAIGVALLVRLARLDARSQPFAAAMFGSTALLVMFSYGMWQYWFMELFALAAVAFATGLAACRQGYVP